MIMKSLKKNMGLFALVPIAIAMALDADALGIDEAKELYCESLRFNYCGTNGVVRPERGVPHEKVLPLMLKHQEDKVKRDIEFYELLKRFEVASMERGSSVLGEGVDVGRRLMSFKADVDTLSFWGYVSLAEYSLIRIIESGTVEIGINDIENVLPDGLFKSKSNGGRYPDREAVHKAFKNMIVVAWALGRWKRDHGSFPESIRELDVEDKWLKGILGADLEYRVVNGVWQLFSPGAPEGKDRGRFNEYVPDMCAAHFWPQSSCLWLSSEYSAKRRHLYETGTLYDAKSPCGCKLEGGCITRQTWFPEQTPINDVLTKGL